MSLAAAYETARFHYPCRRRGCMAVGGAGAAAEIECDASLWRSSPARTIPNHEAGLQHLCRALIYDGKPSHTVSIMEFSGGQVARETQHFAGSAADTASKPSAAYAAAGLEQRSMSMATPDTLRYTRIPLTHGSGAIPAVGFGTLIPDPARDQTSY